MIIVTGGSGFIGSNIIKELNSRGYKEIVIVDDFENSKKHKNINKSQFMEIVLKRDFFNYLKKINIKEIDVIFHQGACTDTLEFNGNYMLDNNYIFTDLLIDFCLINNIRLIYASSAAVYGHGEKGFKEIENCENPLNIYGFSKLCVDKKVRKIINNAKKQIVGLRYFNVYGPGEFHKGKMASTMYQFYNQIKSSGCLKLFEGSDSFLRDFIYVNDVVNVNMHFFDNANFSGIFNCGTGRVESFLDVGKEISSNMENSTISFIPFPMELKDKYQKYTKSNNKKLKETNYRKKFTSLKKGIKEYIKFLEKQNGN